MSGKAFDASATVSIGYGSASVSGSVGFGKTDGKTDWIEEQTALIAKDRLSVRTENHTQIDAALIHSESGHLLLDTHSLGYNHHQGQDREHGWYLNAGGSYSFTGTNNQNPAKALPDKSQNDKSGNNSWNLSGYDYQKDRQQSVLATIGDGQIIVRNDLVTGNDSLIGINRDPSKASQITRDYSRNTELYLSNTFIDAAVNPEETWQQWKDNLKNYHKNTWKTLDNSTELLAEIGARAEQTWQAIQAQRVTLEEVPDALRQHLSDEQALAVTKNLVRNGVNPEEINQLAPESLEALGRFAKEVEQFNLERAQCEAKASCTDSRHTKASTAPVITASGERELPPIIIDGSLTEGESLLSGANELKKHLDNLPSEQVQTLMIGTQALMGPAKAVVSLGGNWLLNHLYGDDIAQAKEGAAVRTAAAITPPTAKELEASNTEGKIAYRNGESDTNGDERVQGAVFIFDVAVLGGSRFFARAKRNHSADKLAIRVENKSNITIRDHYKHHDEMVKDIKRQLKSQGYEVSNRTVSFGSSCSTGRCMPDIIYKTPNGQISIIEVKTGNSGLSIRQSEIFPQIKDGNAIPRGDVAIKFGLIPGIPLKEQGYPNGISIEVLRFPRAVQ